MSVLNRIKKPIIDLFSQRTDELTRNVDALRQRLDDMLVLQGRALALQNIARAPLRHLHDAEFKVFSQFGEDGILQYLIHETGITQQESIFIELGVQNYAESNTRFLLVNNHWRGMIIDGSKDYMENLRHQSLYWRHDLTAIHAWIDRDNINSLMGEAGFAGQIGVLSIDIDGNDYWIWDRINVVNPIIVVVEWNSVLGKDLALSIPYDPNFQREKAHHSGLYWGASIKAFEYLAKKKGYYLIGSTKSGGNLFFVRKDRIGRLKPLSVGDAYIESSFRDSRDQEGKLNFIGGEKRRLELLDLPLIEVVSGKTVTLRELDKKLSDAILK